MPQVGADGDVVDITLHTVKVQPRRGHRLDSLMSESFKNWKGMQASGGRGDQARLYRTPAARFTMNNLIS